MLVFDEKCDRLIAVIREQIAADAEVQLETVADLICGIYLYLADRSEWSK